jgi:hypothetical protein
VAHKRAVRLNPAVEPPECPPGAAGCPGRPCLILPAQPADRKTNSSAAAGLSGSGAARKAASPTATGSPTRRRACEPRRGAWRSAAPGASAGRRPRAARRRAAARRRWRRPAPTPPRRRGTSLDGGLRPPHPARLSPAGGRRHRRIERCGARPNTLVTLPSACGAPSTWRAARTWWPACGRWTTRPRRPRPALLVATSGNRARPQTGARRAPGGPSNGPRRLRPRGAAHAPARPGPLRRPPLSASLSSPAAPPAAPRRPAGWWCGGLAGAAQHDDVKASLADLRLADEGLAPAELRTSKKSPAEGASPAG